MCTAPRSNEGPAITATLPRTLASLTMYGELSVALAPEEFALVHARLQQEWSFDGSFVSRYSIMFLNFQLIRYSSKSS